MPLRLVAAGGDEKANEHPKVDIFAVHGLNPWGNPDHAYDTWRKPKGDTGNLWLRDELPKAIPHARIFLYQYDSSPAFGTSKERFVHQANDFLERVHIKRTDCSKRPIILMGHSLGGILIKQALVNAHNNSRYRLIKEATTGLVFFGTPHAGGKDALVLIGRIAARVATNVLRNPSKDILEALGKGSLFSDVLQEGWRHQLNLYRIVSFYEGIGDIVPRESAVLGLSGEVENQVRLEADHGNVCCFDLSLGDDADNYEVVCANIQELYNACLAPLKQKETPEAARAKEMKNLTAALDQYGMKDLASYMKPIPEKYEAPNANYKAVLSQDPKRSHLHLLALRDSPIVLGGKLRGGTFADPRNSNGDTPLHVVAYFGKPSADAAVFIESDADVNAQNNQGNTPLHLYLITTKSNRAQRLVAIELLLHRGADASIETGDGRTPLMLAVGNNFPESIKPLVNAGAIISTRDNKGNEVLHEAIISGRTDCVRALLDAGANVDSLNDADYRAVELAVIYKRPDCLQELIDRGAMLFVRDLTEACPLDARRSELAELLGARART